MTSKIKAPDNYLKFDEYDESSGSSDPELYKINGN